MAFLSILYIMSMALTDVVISFIHQNNNAKNMYMSCQKEQHIISELRQQHKSNLSKSGHESKKKKSSLRKQTR